MATGIGFIIILAVLLVCMTWFFRSPKERRLKILHKTIVFFLLAMVVLLLFWMGMMVFVVGPSMRQI